MKRLSLPVAVILLLGLCAYIGFRLGSSEAAGSGSAGRAQVSAHVGYSTPDSPRAGESSLPGNHRGPAREPRKPKEMRELGKFGPRGVYDYRLLGDGAEVTGAALKAAGIPLSRKGEVQGLVDILWRDLAADLAERITLDEKETPPDRSLRVYRIPGDPARAAERLKQFHAALRLNFGDSEGDILFDGLNCKYYFGKFGEADLRVVFSNTITYPGVAAPRVKIFISGAPTYGPGKPTASFIGEDHLWELFGAAFDQVEP